MLDKQRSNIQTLVTLKNDGVLSAKNLETNAIRPLYLIQDSISKLLQDNNIIQREVEENKASMVDVLQAIMKLQTA